MIDFKAILEKHEKVKHFAKAMVKCKERATDTSVHLSDMPRGEEYENRQEDKYVKVVDATENYLRAYKEREDMKKELEVYLPRLEKWQVRKAIEYRYMEGRTNRETADAIGYEERQTRRFIREGEEIINRQE